jgi:hypothetical protein
MRSLAEPLPTEPKMKFESLVAICDPAGGYTTRKAIGPATLGTAGTAGADAGGGFVVAGGVVAVGVGAGAAGPASGPGLGIGPGRQETQIRASEALTMRVAAVTMGAR